KGGSGRTRRGWNESHRVGPDALVRAAERSSASLDRRAALDRADERPPLGVNHRGLDFLQPFARFPQCQFTLQLVALLAIANLALERRQQIEGDVCRLEFPGISLRDVVHQ